MISAKLIASSTPGIANAKSCIIDPIIPFWSAVRPSIALLAFLASFESVRKVLALFDHLLDRARRIDLHGVEVVEPVDSSGIL